MAPLLDTAFTNRGAIPAASSVVRQESRNAATNVPRWDGHYVYSALDPTRGAVKFGVTRRPRGRIQDLRRWARGARYLSFAIFQCSIEARRRERRLHEVAAPDRVTHPEGSGEWYAPYGVATVAARAELASWLEPA